MELRGKRLLVIGGSNFADEIASFAQEKGIIIVSTGNTEDSPIKRIAQEKYNIDTTNYDGMRHLVRQAKIDGIFAGGNEPNIQNAIRVSSALNLPYYCDMKQWDALMNKSHFKSLCHEYSIKTPRDYCILSEKDVEGTEIEFPVIVKPADSCGSKGVQYCGTREQLISAVRTALNFSDCGKVVVEQYVAGDEISATYTICNGIISLSCMKDKYPIAGQTGLQNMPNAFIYPSKHLRRYMKEVNGHAIRMFKSLDLQYGTLFLQGFVNKDGIYMFEAGYRPGGTNDFRYTDLMNGVNHMHLLIEQALTGTVNDTPNERDDPFFKKVCCSFTMCARGGNVTQINGLENIKKIKDIKNTEQFYHVGDAVPSGTTLAQRMLRFFILSDSIERTAEVINTIQNYVNVLDENGKSILFGPFDTNRLFL